MHKKLILLYYAYNTHAHTHTHTHFGGNIIILFPCIRLRHQPQQQQLLRDGVLLVHEYQ